MNIAIIGNDAAFNEAKMKLESDHQYIRAEVFEKDIANKSIDVVFDFNYTWSSETALAYSIVTAPVFLNTVYGTLASSPIKTIGDVFGFCGMPTFFDRSLIEVVCADHNQEKLKLLMNAIGLNYIVIKDQVGMVTPRVICMIINEAYEALQQGVASKEDIDLSMKLGTNYPFGPFEWSERIGLNHIRVLLQSIKAKEIFV